MPELLTIGYESTVLPSFIDALKAADVDLLLDIRDLPNSRKAGFSKRTLSASVEEAGMAYRHLKPLGSPKPIRELARAHKYSAFEAAYRERLAEPDAQLALLEALDLASHKRTCLLCYENDYHHCHRLWVAEAMAERSEFSIVHLAPGL